MRFRVGRRALVIAGVLLGAVALWASWDVCVSAWLFQGVKVPHCPDGRFRQTVSLRAESLAREGTGFVTVWAEAHAAGNSPGARMRAPVRRLEAELLLVDAQGKESPLPVEKDWEEWGSGRRAVVKLPAVPDGDYRLRARITSPLGEDTAEAVLPLYAPARVHVLTDRPLYEPGHVVRFRAVALRAKDLTPLDGRPGRWRVTDSQGEVVLEQHAPAGPWGVVSGDFPLDRGSPTGEWRVSWESGGASGEAAFQVKPFTLPRFRVEARSERPFWRAGDSPGVAGQVVYSSGAPVADAAVEVAWRHEGSWPPPTDWLSGEGLPKRARTDATGRFRLALPRVPSDLRGQSTLTAWVSATDPAGDRVTGLASVLLAEDALAVSAVTELEEGLVAGYSNRVYLRATTAEGRLLPGAELTVKRAWDPRDEGVRAVADEDGVAALQLDPGPPVNVIILPLPVRPPLPQPPVRLAAAGRNLLAEPSGLRLEDQLALERLLPALYPCARFVTRSAGFQHVSVTVRVGAGGAVADVVADNSPTGACLAATLRTRALPPGPERMLELLLGIQDPGLPTLSLMAQQGVHGLSNDILQVLQLAALEARPCLPPELSVWTPLPSALMWRVRPGKRELEVSWVSLPVEEGMLSATHLSCIQSHFGRRVLPQEENSERMGVVRFHAEPAGGNGPGAVAQATTLLGYELQVSARVGQEEVGSTKLVLRPAQLPTVRLRATPVLARAGEEVRIELLRGPDFRGELPEVLVLQSGESRWEAKVEKPGRVARFRLPEDFQGWAEASWAGAVARVYAPPRARLSVEVAAEKATYAPGDMAHLKVFTRVDGKEGPAAVGLFGVDAELAQLVPLPGPESLEDLRPAPTVDAPAFGVLDGVALAMGRIRGANAASAALLRVSGVPQRAQVETPLTVSAESTFDPEVELTEPFYRVLAELTAQVRSWEQSAPEGETLGPPEMARLWGQALAACEKRGEAVTDAYGRKLKLSRLPPELLAFTDPRAVVVDGTRLPEDVENWGEWVAREAP
jgi:hypothetical protein